MGIANYDGKLFTDTAMMLMLKRAAIVIAVFYSTVYAQQDSSVIWLFDRVDSIGGLIPAKLNDAPVIIETPYGKAALFDGVNDGLLFNSNPIANASSFTIEIFFRPDSNTLDGDNGQPRFFHLRPFANNDRRITMETRILINQRWAFDSFIRSETSNLTQLDSSQTNSSGVWHHAAITYRDSIMKQFVDGKEQLSGRVAYLPIDASGRISIGVRQDPRYWFKGAIKMIKFSTQALLSSQFMYPVVTGIKKKTAASDESGMLHNFPNPFNPSTTIRYSLPTSCYVHFQIYNLLGQQIFDLINTQQSAGEHELNWKTDAASGIFFYKIEAVSLTDSKQRLTQLRKMLKLK